MKSLRDGASGGILKYLLFGLLGMAVGGLALSGSFATGGAGSNDVASVGNKVINIREFDNALRRSISRYNISVQQAYKLGLAEDVLTGEIRAYFLLNESENLGLEIGKDQIAKRIAQVIKPYAQEGQSLQDTLKLLLRRQGMSEKSFIASIKKEMAGEIITKAIRDSFAPKTDLLAKDLYIFQEQTRDIDIIIFPDNEINTLEPATEEQLTRLYNAVKSNKYKIPEYRKVDVAAFNIETMDIAFETTAEEVQQYYEENIKTYAVGEQLLLSQALVQEEKIATDIYALTEKGHTLKDAVIKVMGKDDKFLEKVPFDETVMLPELNKALESREVGKIISPIKTALGYHVVKLVDIIPPTTRPLSNVKFSIEKELIEAKKSDYLYDISNEFDELLSDGLSFEDIAKEIDIKLSSIDFVDSKGLNKEGNSSFNEYSEEDKSLAAETIFELESDAPSSMQEFGDKFIAFSLTEKEDATFKPYEEVNAELAAQFMADQQRVENQQKVRKYLAELTTGGSTLKSIAKSNKKSIKEIKGITVNGEVEAPLNKDVRPLIFKTTLGGHEVLNLDGSVALIKVSGYSFPEMNEEDLTKIKNIQANVAEEIKNEGLLVYVNQLSNKNPATINQRLLDRVYAPRDEDANQ